MPLVGLCGEPKEALEKIEYMMQALSLQGQFSEEEPVRAEKNRQTEFVRITEKSAEALEALDCLIWSGSCENVLSEEVDSLLEEYPRLAVIFVADSPEAVFDALTKPFFHVVRGYALEQDLKAALAKMKKQRRTGSGYRSFPYRESPSSDGRIRVREKEILYLESMRHEIWVHCEKKVFLTSETLGYWEEKLRVRSFLRVHKSFLVNPRHVQAILTPSNSFNKFFQLSSGESIPISQSQWLRGVDPACGISGVRQRVNQNREERENNGRDDFGQ